MTYIPTSEKERQFLESYDPLAYPCPAVAADTALFAPDGGALKLLLIRRGNYPYKNRWALPGGFVDIDEDILHAAKRELLEETGLSDVYLEQVFCWGHPERDPRHRMITISHVGLADISAHQPKAGDDACEAEWFTLSDYTTREENGNTVVSYTLRGSQTLNPVVSYPKGRMQLIVPADSSGLAFDHAESIAYSYAYLRQRIRSGFLELAFEDETLRNRARELLLLT